MKFWKAVVAVSIQAVRGGLKWRGYVKCKIWCSSRTASAVLDTNNNFSIGAPPFEPRCQLKLRLSSPTEHIFNVVMLHSIETITAPLVVTIFTTLRHVRS